MGGLRRWTQHGGSGAAPMQWKGSCSTHAPLIRVTSRIRITSPHPDRVRGAGAVERVLRGAAAGGERLGAGGRRRGAARVERRAGGEPGGGGAGGRQPEAADTGEARTCPC